MVEGRDVSVDAPISVASKAPLSPLHPSLLSPLVSFLLVSPAGKREYSSLAVSEEQISFWISAFKPRAPNVFGDERVRVCHCEK